MSQTSDPHGYVLSRYLPQVRSDVLLDYGLGALVGGIDAVIRRFAHVYEFDQDPRCLFRLEICPARHGCTLRDGTQIMPGAPIGILHYWNEHLLRFPRRGPDIRWAKSMLRGFSYSLEALSRHVERNPDLTDVVAFCGTPRLALRPNAARQLRKVAEAYGFEMVAREDAKPGLFAAAAEGVRTLSFALAYNPGASMHSSFFKQRQCLWLSRNALRARYGHGTSGSRPWEG